MSCIENFEKIYDANSDAYGIVFYDDYDFEQKEPLRYEWFPDRVARDYVYHEYCMDI